MFRGIDLRFWPRKRPSMYPLISPNFFLNVHIVIIYTHTMSFVEFCIGVRAMNFLISFFGRFSKSFHKCWPIILKWLGISPKKILKVCMIIYTSIFHTKSFVEFCIDLVCMYRMIICTFRKKLGKIRVDIPSHFNIKGQHFWKIYQNIKLKNV